MNEINCQYCIEQMDFILIRSRVNVSRNSSYLYKKQYTTKLQKIINLKKDSQNNYRKTVLNDKYTAEEKVKHYEQILKALSSVENTNYLSEMYLSLHMLNKNMRFITHRSYDKLRKKFHFPAHTCNTKYFFLFIFLKI